MQRSRGIASEAASGNIVGSALERPASTLDASSIHPFLSRTCHLFSPGRRFSCGIVAERSRSSKAPSVRRKNSATTASFSIGFSEQVL